MDTKLKLVKLSADGCGYCKALERAGTVEKFLAAHPDVALENVHTTVEGDAADLRIDDYDVMGIPAFIWEDMEGNLVHKAEGSTNLAGLERQYQAATKKLESGDFGKDRRPRKRGRG